ncbi:hypothetical protein LTR24_005065 [Lithohypha guttulata]|uniref:Terpene synthase n=1 Tax=Lithohypha guttulata TaxID=1690604 RepID=A0ABR0KBP6_9EURO|nr:hypothetical protein LTR24_005065 [Lithohypha guttulata]
MSVDDGIVYNDKLMRLARGDELPDRSVPVEYLMYDIWASMREHDKELADEVLEPAFVFMRAQVDKQRLKPMDLHTYFKYREQDVGKAFLSAIMRFSMGLRLSESEHDLARPVEENASKSISVINDICSYEKEVRVAAQGHEGGALCSSVPIMQSIADVDVDGAKRILWSMCREWEVRHVQLVQEIREKNKSAALAAYMEGLEYQMAGNEVWSLETPRYNDVTVG